VDCGVEMQIYCTAVLVKIILPRRVWYNISVEGSEIQHSLVGWDGPLCRPTCVIIGEGQTYLRHYWYGEVQTYLRHDVKKWSFIII
jgi:hypothetical protein